MMTKTKLYALDLRSFTATIEQLGEQLRANQEKLDEIAHAKETIASGMQGQSAQAMIAKLDALEQKINDHITSIQETQAAITTYRTNKQQLQRDVIDCVDDAELSDYSISDDWIVRPTLDLLRSLTPDRIGRRFAEASIIQTKLFALVSTFDLYDQHAPISSSGGVTPYTTSQGFSTIEPDRSIEWDDYFPHGSKAGQDTPEDWAYEEDAGVRNSVNLDLNASLQAANEAVMAGHTDLTLYSPKHSTPKGYYPQTENWQRTIGGHTTYTDTDVKVEGDTVTATVTVYARDKWNFNNGQSDPASGTPDAVNGRSEEPGWGKSFESSGSLTRTYTWKVGEQPPILDTNTTENKEEKKTDDYKKYSPL